MQSRSAVNFIVRLVVIVFVLFYFVSGTMALWQFPPENLCSYLSYCKKFTGQFCTTLMNSEPWKPKDVG